MNCSTLPFPAIPLCFVRFSSDKPSAQLSAVKTAVNQNGLELLRREADILNKLNHPLVLELQQYIPKKVDGRSAIVTEFAGNGSLATFITPLTYQLRGANRIAKILIGIALEMRFVHSRAVIHRNLKPANILVDWDWNVRNRDFGHSISPDNPLKPLRKVAGRYNSDPSVDPRYCAPECSDKLDSPASDVFSFGMILCELLTGEPAFPIDLTHHQVVFKVVNDERPEIPEWVLPSIRKLITDCWAKDPRERPSFKEIVSQLEELKFKVTYDVNSLKLKKFVNEIEELERVNIGIVQ
jgi:serine/threonine protein kinase